MSSKVQKPKKKRKGCAQTASVNTSHAQTEKGGFKGKGISAEIEEIFASKKPHVQPKSTRSSLTEDKPAPLKAPEEDSFADTRGMRGKTRPLTDDGLPVFTAKEMELGKGGDTPECPFDCQCCY